VSWVPRSTPTGHGPRGSTPRASTSRAFCDRPLSPDALRCLLHDIEQHTVCYLRDLLLTPAHQDPEITSFLACWVFEELWHGEAIAEVLAAHGETAGSPRIATLRRRRKWRDTLGVAAHFGTSTFAGEQFIAVHVSWGAVNEWTTQAAYGRSAASRATRCSPRSSSGS